MSYLLRKNYFKDYFWQNTCIVAPYDNHYWWYDSLWTEGNERWYCDEMHSTSTFYGHNSGIHVAHYYPAPDTNKHGMLIDTGGANVDGANRIHFIESANEATMPGAARPGFEGQYGADKSIHYTGTQYEFSVAFDLASQENTTVGPHGMSIYADAGAGGTMDGLHVIFVPINSILTMKDIDGNWVTYNADGSVPTIVVATGQLDDPINMVAIESFTTWNDTTALTYSEDDEYFCRIEYWPERKTFKQFRPDYNAPPNLDRRLRIWYYTDKKRMNQAQYFVGEVACVDYSFNTKQDYVQLFAYDYYYEYSIKEAWEAYQAATIQFGEVTVGSEWMPYLEMDVDDGMTDNPSYARVKYAKEDNERTHTFGDATFTNPNWKWKDELEVWSRCALVPVRQDLEYYSDFLNAFADGWTVTDTTGTWTQTDPVTYLRDEFDNSYSNKNNDTNWVVNASTWDTSTTSGWLKNTGTIASIYWTEFDCSDGDFVCDFYLDFTGNAANEGFIAFGYNAAVVVNSALQITFRASDNRIQLNEYQVGWNNLDSTTSYDPEGEHTWKLVRIGGIAKVYLDGVLILSSVLATLICTNDDIFVQAGTGTTTAFDYIRAMSVFPNGFAYMENTGSTQTVGSIYRAVVADHISGFCDVTMWEAFSEGSDDGYVRLNMHYDNGVSGTDLMGITVNYEHATTTKTLKLHYNSGNVKTINLPTNPTTWHHGYTEHKYRISWIVNDDDEITDIQVTNGEDGEFLGSYTGLALDYLGSMRLEFISVSADGCEMPYVGSVFFFETPSTSLDMIEVPVYHGQVNKIQPADSKGGIVVDAMPMTYPLRKISSYDSVGLHWESEENHTDSSLITIYLGEDAFSYWKWFHSWNFDSDNLPASWIPHRMRGVTAHAIFSHIAEYSGFQFRTTPEQCFIFRQYDRDLYAADLLELSTFVPEGLYFSLDDATYYNKTQTNYLDEVVRADDATVGKRVSEIEMIPADFQDAFGGPGTLPADHDQVWQSLGAAHADPRMTAWNTEVRTGNLAADEGSTSPAIIRATAGAIGPPAAATTDPATFLQDWGDEVMKSYSHKNQFWAITVVGSKQFFRPMDLIEVKIDTLDDSLEDVAAVLQHTNKYVIHKAIHKCHENKVTYIVGRQEVDSGDVIDVDGYGDVYTNNGAFQEVAKTAKEGLSQSNQ